tara:strand:+ start:721 stop:1365 length:645 start_codon:yes stop_codon:yes gene_type:complete
MTTTSVFDDSLKEFRRSVEITRDVRFQANLRLMKRQRWSSYMISILSLYVIFLSLLPNIFSLNEKDSQILLSCSVILSVFVIFTSIIDGSQNFYHQGELLHRCARKIATVYHKLKNIDPSDVSSHSDLEKLQEEYREILDDCPINHDNMDYTLIKSTKPHLFPRDYEKVWVGWKSFYLRVVYLMLSSSWMVLHVAALIAVSVVVYGVVTAPSGK